MGFGFGAKRLGKDRGHAINLLRRAAELGINHIDTAAWYPTYADARHAVHDSSALHWANDVIREALQPYAEGLVIATKVGPTEDGLAPRPLERAAAPPGAGAGHSSDRRGPKSVWRRFGRTNDEMLADCGRQGIAFVPFFALAGTGREIGGVTRNDTVDTFARAHAVSPAQVRIAWTLSRGPHVLAIPGTSNLEHLAENLQAGSLILEPELLALETEE